MATEPVTSDPQGRPLTVAEVAERLGVSLNTLRRWRHRGIGPSFSMLGKHLMTTAGELDAWVERRPNESAPLGDSRPKPGPT
jgi:excisionase family DNA binding protein